MRTFTQRLQQVLALVLTIAALTVGGQALAESKTVTYKMQAEITYGSGGTTGCKLTFVPFGDGFGYSTGQKIAIISNIQSTSGFGVELDDGLRLQFRFNSGSKVTLTNKDGYHGIMLNYQADQNTYITVRSINYYVSHIKMANLNGDAIGGLATPWMTSTGALDQDVTMVPDGHTPTTYSTFIAHVTGSQIFAQLTITYSDAPAIGVFEAAGTDTYNIKDKYDLRHLADYVNNGKNECSGLTFLQTQDITCDDTYVPIGYYISNSDKARFSGTYNGQGHTVSGITVNRTGDTSADGYVGLFGYVNYNSSTDYGTVRNVVLANSTFTGCDFVGGIVGLNSGGTVQNCRVESSVIIKAGCNGAVFHGGIVGDNHSVDAKVIGCFSAASIQNNSKSGHKDCGGIVGYNQGGTIQDCLYTGNTIEGADKKGGIVGYSEGSNATFTNNYYTSVSIGGVGAEGSSSDQDGARRARLVNLGENVGPIGNEIAYDVSELLAIGTTVLCTGNTLYSGEGQTVTFNYFGEDPVGYLLTFSTTAGTLEGATLTMPDEDVTVTATIAPITYTVHFDANGGSGEMDDQTFTYGEAQNLTACAFSDAGENFLGWSTQANGLGTSYSDGEEVNNLTAEDGATITLYAQWDHDWGLPVWNWAADCSSATAVFTCANCGDIQSVTASGNNTNSENCCVKLGTGENYYARVYFKWHRYEDLFGPDVLGPGQHRVDLKRPYYMICPQWDYMAYHITSAELDLYVRTALDEEFNPLILFDPIRSYSVGRFREDGSDFDGNFDLFENGGMLASVAFQKDDGSEGQIDVNIKPVLFHRFTIEQSIPDATLSVSYKVNTTSNISNYISRGLIYEDGIVWLTCTPDDPQADLHVLWSVTDADGQSIPVRYHEGAPYFVMPAKNVTIRTLDALPWEGEGTGTEDDPYQISSYAELKQFASIVNGTGGEAYAYAYAKLVDDIVCKNSFGDTEFATDWVPIGNASHPYIGTFDGQGHTITGLSTPTDNTSDYVGLFGYIGSYGVVKDVILEYATMTGNSNVGVVAGHNDGTLTGNYYISCSANDATANIGTGSGDCDGARGLYTITLPEGATASAATITLDYTDYVAAGTTVTLSYSGTPPEGFAAQVVYCLNGTTIDSNTFTMPAEDVTVSAHWAVPYIDADGDEQNCTNYTFLESTGSTVTLGTDGTESWYVVSGNVDITANGIALYFNGAVHLILMDGAMLTVEGNTPIKVDGCLSIYGQSGGTGSLEANGIGIGIAIEVNEATTAVANNGTLTINGGTVTATGSVYGIVSKNGDITINGGTVIASSSDHHYPGIKANGTITLGWRNLSDRITASSYQGGNGIVVKEGQTLTDGTDIYSGTLTTEQIDVIAHQTLQPCVRLTLPDGVIASGTGIISTQNGTYALPGNTVTLSYSGTPPEGFAAPVVYSLNGTTIDSDTFTMPAEDVTVSTRWAVPYIDADGSTKYCRDYTVIDPSKNGYGNKNSEDWYVVCGTVNVTFLYFNGPAHVILCDGASLTVNGYEGQILTDFSLTIYGQSEGTGSITANSEYDEENYDYGIGIKARDFTLCGGNITLTGDICGLYATTSLTVHRGSINATGSYTGNDVYTFGTYGGAGICSNFITINGGTVVGTGGNVGIYQDSSRTGDFTINGGSVSGTGTNYKGIQSFSSIIINGGQVSASGGSVGLYSDYDMILGCSSTSDYITATSFGTFNGDILVKDGQTLTDGTDIYSGTLTTEQINAIAGKTLQLVDAIVLRNDADNTSIISNHTDETINVMLYGRTLYKNGTWNTLCLPFDVTLSGSVLDGADARALNSTSLSNGLLSLNFSAQGDVTRLTAGTPYIIRWASGENLVNPVFERVTISDASTTTETDCVDFIGTYAPINFTEDDATKLFVGADNKLYYPLSGAKVNAFRGYFQLKNGLTIGDSSNPRIRSVVLNTDGDDPTSIKDLNDLKDSNDLIYNLAGQRLSKTRKGINIVEGRKVIRK